MVKPLTKVKVHPGSSVPCEQCKECCTVRVKEVSGQIFKPCKRSLGVQWLRVLIELKCLCYYNLLVQLQDGAHFWTT